MIGKLNILEPWEFGTEKGINIKDIDKSKNQFLLYTEEPYVINNHKYEFFLAKPKGKVNLFSVNKKDSILLEMVYDKNLSPENFTSYQIKDFRDNFFLGELKLI